MADMPAPSSDRDFRASDASDAASLAEMSRSEGFRRGAAVGNESSERADTACLFYVKSRSTLADEASSKSLEPEEGSSAPDVATLRSGKSVCKGCGDAADDAKNCVAAPGRLPSPRQACKASSGLIEPDDASLDHEQKESLNDCPAKLCSELEPEQMCSVSDSSTEGKDISLDKKQKDSPCKGSVREVCEVSECEVEDAEPLQQKELPCIIIPFDNIPGPMSPSDNAVAESEMKAKALGNCSCGDIPYFGENIMFGDFVFSWRVLNKDKLSSSSAPTGCASPKESATSEQSACLGEGNEDNHSRKSPNRCQLLQHPADQMGILGPAPAARNKASDVVRHISTFYIVKIPKPSNVQLKAKIRLAEFELKEKTHSRDYIQAALNLKKANRTDILQYLRNARDEERKTREAAHGIWNEMEPFQKELTKLRNAKSAARENNHATQNLCSSEEELDEKIAHLEFRIQHESMPLKEEKKLVQEIKRLLSSRQQVCKNVVLNVAVKEFLNRKEEIQINLKPFNEKLEALENEHQQAMIKVNAAEKDYQNLLKSLKQLQLEWEAVSEDCQHSYETLKRLRWDLNQQNDKFYHCLRKIKAAKLLAIQKDTKALKDLCSPQVEEFFRQWNNDESFRREYVKTNEQSTLRRLKTLDGRLVVTDEDPDLHSIGMEFEHNVQNNVFNDGLHQKKTSVKEAEDNITCLTEPINDIDGKSHRNERVMKEKEPVLEENLPRKKLIYINRKSHIDKRILTETQPTNQLKDLMKDKGGKTHTDEQVVKEKEDVMEGNLPREKPVKDMDNIENGLMMKGNFPWKELVKDIDSKLDIDKRTVKQKEPVKEGNLPVSVLPSKVDNVNQLQVAEVDENITQECIPKHNMIKDGRKGLVKKNKLKAGSKARKDALVMPSETESANLLEAPELKEECIQQEMTKANIIKDIKGLEKNSKTVAVDEAMEKVARPEEEREVIESATDIIKSTNEPTVSSIPLSIEADGSAVHQGNETSAASEQSPFVSKKKPSSRQRKKGTIKTLKSVQPPNIMNISKTNWKTHLQLRIWFITVSVSISCLCVAAAFVCRLRGTDLFG